MLGNSKQPQLDKHNANKGTERGRAMVEASLRETGAGRSILVDKEGRVIAGNKTLEAWGGLADEGNIEVVHSDGQKLVVVQRDDLDLDDPKGLARRLAYLDNRSSEVGLAWDIQEVLASIDVGLDLDGLWDQGEIKDLFAGLETNGQEPPEDPGPQIDRAEELRDKWGVEAGQMWELGEHRVVCGDCTDKAAVERVMGGERLGAVVTDPPYGIGIQSTSAMKNKAGGWHDAMNNFVIYESYYRSWIELMETGLIWCFINWRTLPVLMRSVADLGYSHESILIWDKEWIGPGGPIGLRPSYEMVTLLAVGGARIKDRGVPDIYRCQWSSHKPTGHKAEKPADLLEHLVKMTEGTVYDPFLGSGTTLIACERLKRKCRGIEIDPGYVAVTLERWHEMTGQMPVLFT